MSLTVEQPLLKRVGSKTSTLTHRDSSMAPPPPPRFGRPAVAAATSRNLFVANCGPAVGISHDAIGSAFAAFGAVEAVHAADDTGARVVVSFSDEISAVAALEALDGRPCASLAGRTLHVRYSSIQPIPSGRVDSPVKVSLSVSELNIPGLYLLLDFVSAEQEQALLASVDQRPWKNLAKRRVQHYGYEFCYETRNVDATRQLGEFPAFVLPVLEKISMFKNLGVSSSLDLDQLTVNEYPPGVGLSPHIDTHSAFEGLIFSLSLAGPCIMEFRRYEDGNDRTKASLSNDSKIENPENNSDFVRKAVHLPPRSMLLLSGEARYAWHHYIPHHKIDVVNDRLIRRGSRRVSFTFRKVRTTPCNCEFPQYCDSQQ